MKIALVWTHWVGKSSTLESIEYPKIQEVARRLIQQGMVQGTQELQRAIFLEQKAQEQYMDWFISDRSIRDNLAYARYISEELYQELVQQVDSTYDKLYFLPIQFDIIDDGVRPQDRQFQHDIQDTIIQILQENNIEYEMLHGDIDQRKNTILSFLWNAALSL